MKSHALWHESPVNSVILEHNLPDGGHDQLLIESLFSLISLGTEKQVALGRVPPDIHEAMKVPYMEGSFLFPCKYGYSLAGKVIQGDPELKDKIVHVMHPHQDFAWVDRSSAFLIPDGVPPQRAVLAGNLETAVNTLWDSEISIGDSILIAGFGLIGALIAILASGIPGIAITVYEKNEFRCRLALQLGFRVFSESGKTDHLFDAAINTTGDENALQFCIDKTGYESQVTEVSFYGSKPVSVLLGGSFHSARKRIVVSQVSHIPGNRLNRWDHRRRKDLVFHLLRDKRYDSLTGNVIPFKESPGVFTKLRGGSINEISVLLRYQ